MPTPLAPRVLSAQSPHGAARSSACCNPHCARLESRMFALIRGCVMHDAHIQRLGFRRAHADVTCTAFRHASPETRARLSLSSPFLIVAECERRKHRDRAPTHGGPSAPTRWGASSAQPRLQRWRPPRPAHRILSRSSGDLTTGVILDYAGSPETAACRMCHRPMNKSAAAQTFIQHPHPPPADVGPTAGLRRRAVTPRAPTRTRRPSGASSSSATSCRRLRPTARPRPRRPATRSSATATAP